MKDIVDAGIQSRIDWRYILQAGNVTSQSYKEQVVNYDEKGRIKEIINIDRNGYNKSIIVFRYDGRNLPILVTEFMPTGELVSKKKYTYTFSGRLQDITWLNSYEFIISKNSYEVVENTKSIIERQYFTPDSVIRKLAYLYSDLDTGVLKEEWKYIGENNLEIKKIVTRNIKNKIENEEFRNFAGELKYYLQYSYNSKGNLSDVIKIFPDGTRVKIFDYNYNELGLITGEIEYSPKGEILQYHKYGYD
jgi:hypothetical protein